MEPRARRGPAQTAGRSAASSDHAERTTSDAEREALQRAHSTSVVLAAIDRGEWPVEVATLDAVAAVLAAASRWALVAELERAG
jgi:hypothetical protein